MFSINDDLRGGRTLVNWQLESPVGLDLKLLKRVLEERPKILLKRLSFRVSLGGLVGDRMIGTPLDETRNG